LAVTRYGTWVAYGGGARVGLALVLLAIATFLGRFGVYVEQGRREFQGRLAGQTLPADPITPVTLTSAVATFVAVLVFGSPRSWIRPISAIIAALAAPLVFELPFDLVVMARTYPRSSLTRACTGRCSSCRCSWSR
jgi:hypothetical protein